MTIESRLQALGINLPPAPKPVAKYVPFVKIGNLVFTSGILPLKDGQLAYSGKLGLDLTVDDGQDAARLAALNGLSVLKEALGDLDCVERIVKLTGYVASAKDFHQQPLVLDGASSLLVDVFGEAGRHARSAVGAAELPLGAPIEIELTVQVKS